MKRSIAAFVLFSLVAGGLALLYVWRSSPPGQRSGTNGQHAGEHPSPPSGGTTDPEGAILKADEGLEAGDGLTQETDGVLKEKRDWAGVALTQAEWGKFYKKHILGFTRWPTFDETRAAILEEIKREYLGGPNVPGDRMLADAEKLLAQFWEEGDLSNANGWKKAFKARILAEEVLDASGWKDERAYLLAEKCIISCIAPDGSPLTDRNNEPDSDVDAFQERVRYRNDLEAISLRHFFDIIAQKPTADITKHDLAVASRIWREPFKLLLIWDVEAAHGYGGIVGKGCKEIFADLAGPSDVKPGDSRQARSQRGYDIKRKLEDYMGQWMLDTCLAKNWQDYGERLERGVAQAKSGGYPDPVSMVYRNRFLTPGEADQVTMLRYLRPIDGFLIEYGGQPVNVPAF